MRSHRSVSLCRGMQPPSSRSLERKRKDEAFSYQLRGLTTPGHITRGDSARSLGSNSDGVETPFMGKGA